MNIKGCRKGEAMKDDINLFSEKELEDLIPWVKAKIDHWQGILQKINKRINLLTQRDLPSLVGESNSHASMGKVYNVMLDAKRWLSNKQILEILEDKTGISLTANGIRVYLRQGEKAELFQRRGKSRFTEWRAIEKKNLQSQ